jgi:hypothetical protein
MSSVSLLDTGIVYRNPRPHLLSRHAYFPSVACAGGGGGGGDGEELVVGMDIGSAFEAVDVRSYSCRSNDGGKTWTPPQLIFSPDPSVFGPVSTTTRIGAVGDGKIVGVISLFDRSRPDEGLANAATEGFVRTTWALVRSIDGGRSWSSPAEFPAPIDWSCFECCSTIVPLRSGRWLIPTSTWPDWDGRDPFGPNAFALISDDRGASWPKAVEVMRDPSHQLTHWEQKQVQLSDGRLLAVCWIYDREQKRDLPNHFCVSSDDGNSYSPPRATPLQGQTCTPIALSDNRVLCVYRRMDRRGLWAHLAQIDGNAWKPLGEDTPIWGTNIAAHTAGDDAGVMAQMSTLRFGFPSLTLLANGDVFGVFWCVEDAVANIRWFKLRA